MIGYYLSEMLVIHMGGTLDLIRFSASLDHIFLSVAELFGRDPG